MLYHFSFLLSQAQSNVFDFSALMSAGMSLINLWKLERFQETFNSKEYQNTVWSQKSQQTKITWQNKKEIISEVMLSNPSKSSLLEYNICS